MMTQRLDTTGTIYSAGDPVRKLFRSPMVHRVAQWANRQPFIWEGIYERYDEVPASGEGFDSYEWISDMERYTDKAVTSLRENHTAIPSDISQYHSLFGLAVAMLQARQKSVRILDFGGGMGIGCANLLRNLCYESGIEYWIVENRQSCERGEELLAKIPYVRFTPELPSIPGNLDLLLMCSVLQFIPNYSELLRSLAEYKASYWLFTFLPAGDIPTFASAQKNVPGSIIPVWFFNLNELVEIMKSLGYQLIFKSAMDRMFDMSNFPTTHRVQRQCNLLFKLNDHSGN